MQIAGRRSIYYFIGNLLILFHVAIFLFFFFFLIETRFIEKRFDRFYPILVDILYRFGMNKREVLIDTLATVTAV